MFLDKTIFYTIPQSLKFVNIHKDALVCKHIIIQLDLAISPCLNSQNFYLSLSNLVQLFPKDKTITH